METRTDVADNLEKDRLFAAWLDDRATPSRQSLTSWLERHPEHADDLLTWATLAPALDPVSGAPDDGALDQVRTLGPEVLADLRARMQPPASLMAVAKRKGIDLEALAAQLDLGEAIVVKLERRLLTFRSVPSSLIQRLANALDLTASQVDGYLRLPPTLAAHASYKADRAPAVRPQQEFADALRTCNEMTSDQKSFWLREAQAS